METTLCCVVRSARIMQCNTAALRSTSTTSFDAGVSSWGESPDHLGSAEGRAGIRLERVFGVDLGIGTR